MSEEIGKHKGAVETLLHEKKELSRILQIVNSQLQKHLEALEEAGVDTDEFINKIQQGGKQKQQQRQRRQETDQQREEQVENNKASKEDIEDENSGESSGTPSSEQEEDDEEDAEDLLEGGNDFEDRDFSPR